MPDGGTIILGVDEATGFTTIGLTDVAAIEQGVAAQARTAIAPPVQCTFDSIEIEPPWLRRRGLLNQAA